MSLLYLITNTGCAHFANLAHRITKRQDRANQSQRMVRRSKEIYSMVGVHAGVMLF